MRRGARSRTCGIRNATRGCARTCGTETGIKAKPPQMCACVVRTPAAGSPGPFAHISLTPTPRCSSTFVSPSRPCPATSSRLVCRPASRGPSPVSDLHVQMPCAVGGQWPPTRSGKCTLSLKRAAKADARTPSPRSADLYCVLSTTVRACGLLGAARIGCVRRVLVGADRCAVVPRSPVPDHDARTRTDPARRAALVPSAACSPSFTSPARRRSRCRRAPRRARSVRCSARRGPSPGLTCAQIPSPRLCSTARYAACGLVSASAVPQMSRELSTYRPQSRPGPVIRALRVLLRLS